ncbi:MAG: DUF1588 domain-containing protein, partial [Bdellovibrionota bacterium]
VIDSRNLTNLTEADIIKMTNKDLTTHYTQEPNCVGCHSFINPTGFAFEVFDSLGRLRTQEQVYDYSGKHVASFPINTTAVVPWGSRSIAVTDANDLASQVSTSSAGQACFAKNVYEFLQSRDIASQDGCHLNETALPLQSGGSILDAFISAAVNRGTSWKRSE